MTSARGVTPAAIGRSAASRLGLLAGIWGVSFLFVELALHGLNPVQIAFGRITLGAATLLLYLVARGWPLPRGATTWAHLAVVSVFGNVVPWLAYAWGQQYVSSGLAGVCNATTPLFTVALATVVLPEERATPTAVSGLGLGFLGTVLVLAPWDTAGSPALGGSLACVGAAASYGVAITYTRRYLSGRGSPPVLAAAQLLCAAGLMVTLAPFWLAPAALTPKVAGSMVMLGAVGTAAAYLLFYRLIGEIGATASSTVTYLIPVVAVVVGVIFLQESVGWHTLAGAAVVLLGVWVAGRRPQR